MSKEKRFNKEAFYINILIGLLFIAMVVIEYQTIESQRASIKTEVDNTATEFETRIKTGVGSIMSLHATAGEIYKNRAIDHKIVSQVHEVNARGDFVLDIPNLSNLTGFGGLESSKKVVHEMATSLALTKYFAIIKNLNSNSVRIYYASKNRFSTSYPYIWSDQFMWSALMLERPQWLFATPALNPEGKLFVTPLHKCLRKEKILVTIGRPLYDKAGFLGSVNMDIAVEKESAFLESKNLHDGVYVIVNEQSEIVAASGLEGYSDVVIHRAKQLLSPEVLAATATNGELVSMGSDYLYVKQFENTPWRLYYIKNKVDIYLNSLYYAGMMFIVILLLFRVKTLIKRLSSSRDELERQALTDPMTKLYNRRYLSEITPHLLGLMRRNNSRLTVVMLDIDKFKNVNDTYGHQVGDDVIIKLAETLQKHTRTSDVIFRLGGEEFLVLLPETGVEGALSVAETLRSEVDKLMLLLGDEIELRFTISLGVAEVQKDEKSFDLSMTRADAALYEAKESGRNRVCRAKTDDETVK